MAPGRQIKELSSNLRLNGHPGLAFAVHIAAAGMPVGVALAGPGLARDSPGTVTVAGRASSHNLDGGALRMSGRLGLGFSFISFVTFSH